MSYCCKCLSCSVPPAALLYFFTLFIHLFSALEFFLTCLHASLYSSSETKFCLFLTFNFDCSVTSFQVDSLIQGFYTCLSCLNPSPASLKIFSTYFTLSLGSRSFVSPILLSTTFCISSASGFNFSKSYQSAFHHFSS